MRITVSQQITEEFVTRMDAETVKKKLQELIDKARESAETVNGYNTLGFGTFDIVFHLSVSR